MGILGKLISLVFITIKLRFRCDPAAAETLDNYNDKLRQIQGRGGSLASVDLNLSQRRLVDRLKACIIKSYTAIQTTLQNSRLWFVVILFAHLWCVVQGKARFSLTSIA